MSSRPHMEARSESSFSLRKHQLQPPVSSSPASSGSAAASDSSATSKPSRGSIKSGVSSRMVFSKEYGSVVPAMSSTEQRRMTRTGSLSKPKIVPRREFGPAQDLPVRQYSLRHNYKVTPPHRRIKKKDVLDTVLTTKVCFWLTIGCMYYNTLRPSDVLLSRFFCLP